MTDSAAMPRCRFDWKPKYLDGKPPFLIFPAVFFEDSDVRESCIRK
jgi:hypothetical protein